MQTIWYTRDDDGDRSLWSEVPRKAQGEWSVDGGDTGLILGDFHGEADGVDAMLGTGVHGLRKGQIAELVLTWNRKA